MALRHRVRVCMWVKEGHDEEQSGALFKRIQREFSVRSSALDSSNPFFGVGVGYPMCARNGASTMLLISNRITREGSPAIMNVSLFWLCFVGSFPSH